MRILTIATSYPRHEGDWAGRFVRDLNAGLGALGHDVTTLAPWAPGLAREEPDGAAGRVVRAGDASSSRLFYGAGAEVNARRLGLLPGLAAFRRASRAFEHAIAALARDADLVLAHWVFPCAWWAAGAGVRAPLVGVVHGADARFLARPLAGRLVARRLGGRLAAVACVSAGAWRTVAPRLGCAGAAAVVTPMGVDTGVFRPASPCRREPGLVVAAGRLVRSKGYDLLLASCAGLGVRVAIAGDGPERAALDRLAHALGVGLDLPGTLPPASLADLFRRAGVVVVPSRGRPGGCEEGVPVVAVEALACGAPVVGTASGGLADVLGSAAVAEASPDSLRRGIAAALAAPERFRDPDAHLRYDRVAVAGRILTGIGA